MPQLLQAIAAPACTKTSHVVLDPGSDPFTFSRGPLCDGELAIYAYEAQGLVEDG